MSTIGMFVYKDVKYVRLEAAMKLSAAISELQSLVDTQKKELNRLQLGIIKHVNDANKYKAELLETKKQLEETKQALIRVRRNAIKPFNIHGGNK